jgi:hypothetical protein
LKRKTFASSRRESAPKGRTAYIEKVDDLGTWTLKRLIVTILLFFLTLKFDDEKQEEHANRHHEDRYHGGPTVRASAHHALDCSSR